MDCLPFLTSRLKILYCSICLIFGVYLRNEFRPPQLDISCFITWCFLFRIVETETKKRVMASFTNHQQNDNGNNHTKADWRDDCVKPPKDNRIQTEVNTHGNAVRSAGAYFYSLL